MAHYEAFRTRSQALTREKQLKKSVLSVSVHEK